MTIFAEVKWKPPAPEEVTLTFGEQEYRMLIGCLTSHANNEINDYDGNKRITNSGTAQLLLNSIKQAVENSKG